jgi:DNA-binding transcriptional LysR family regulator
MDLAELKVFRTVAAEHSFSKAATRLHRTQPAVSQAIKRLEDSLGERLFDRSSRDGRLTAAGQVLLDFAERLTRLTEEAEVAVRQVRDLQRGRVLIGANEGSVHVLLPLIARFHGEHPQISVDVRRVHSRQLPMEVLEGSLDFGALAFRPSGSSLQSVRIGDDELVMLVAPDHPLARQKRISMSDLGKQVVIAHNEASPTRERVLRLFEERHAELNIQIALPSLDAIKRAVELRLGVALLPRRCALTEISLGQLVAVPVAQLRMSRQIRLIYRRKGELSHAATAFLEQALSAAGLKGSGRG